VPWPNTGIDLPDGSIIVRIPTFDVIMFCCVNDLPAIATGKIVPHILGQM
jgi:hypothetical protein